MNGTVARAVRRGTNVGLMASTRAIPKRSTSAVGWLMPSPNGEWRNAMVRGVGEGEGGVGIPGGGGSGPVAPGRGDSDSDNNFYSDHVTNSDSHARHATNNNSDFEQALQLESADALRRFVRGTRLVGLSPETHRVQEHLGGSVSISRNNDWSPGTLPWLQRGEHGGSQSVHQLRQRLRKLTMLQVPSRANPLWDLPAPETAPAPPIALDVDALVRADPGFSLANRHARPKLADAPVDVQTLAREHFLACLDCRPNFRKLPKNPVPLSGIVLRLPAGASLAHTGEKRRELQIGYSPGQQGGLRSSVE
mmetsp:Transcript_14218/g.19751  ORF Transcript_14218/g.19751 Transcript_14218/m.19751 type:complete len:307 (-) Transcript_14218:850-1770(-)